METASSVAHKQSPEAAIRTNNTKKKRLLGRWPYALMGLLLLAVFALSLVLPMFSRVHPKVYVTHPRLFPIYYQTNMDGPGELISSLGFPWILRDFTLRVNRPLVAGLTALVREFAIRPLVLDHLPVRWHSVQWGAWSAVDTLATYFLWLDLNVVFLALAVLAYVHFCRKFLGEIAALFSGIILLATPIVILSLREIQYGCLEILITTASLAFWSEASFGKISRGRLAIFAAVLGILFLGKQAASTFLAGAALYAVFRRKPDVFLFLGAAAVPQLLWILACFAMEIPYQFSEVSGYDEIIWVGSLQSSASLARELLRFGRGWCQVLWENTGYAQMALMAIGLYAFIRAGSTKLIALIAVFFAADFGFYFFINRLHAVYGLHSMVLCFALAAKGLEWILAERLGLRGKSFWIAGVALLILIQGWMNWTRLPHYGG